MSRYRPTLVAATTPGLSYEASYFRVMQAVARRRTLIHGRLEDDAGGTCAVGAYFRESSVPIKMSAIDEIAAYNDSFPLLTPGERWRKVMAWLRFQTKVMVAR